MPCLLLGFSPFATTAILTALVIDYWLNEAIPRTVELLGYKMQIACLYEDGLADYSGWFMEIAEVPINAQAAPNSFLNIINYYTKY